MASFTRGSLNRDRLNMDDAKKLYKELKEKNKSKLKEKLEKHSTKIKKVLTDEDENSDSANEENFKQESTSNQTLKAKKFDDKKQEQSTSSGKSGSTFGSGWWFLLPVVVILVAIGVYMYFNPINTNEEDENLYTSSRRDLFIEAIQDLKVKFPEFPEISIRMINYTILSTLDHNDPRSPATVLLLGTKGNERHTDKVLNYLMEVLSKTYSAKINDQEQYLDFERVDKSNTDQLKMDISLKIDRAFDNNKHSFLAMKNVHQAPWDVVSTLHPYFDHENAPYKRVVYLCTATTNEHMKEEDLKEYRRLAENLFDLAWEKYHSDHRHAMYARLFTSIAVF